MYTAYNLKLKADVKVNEIVPIIIPNIPESRIMIYALNAIGATVYPIVPMISPKKLETILNDNKTKTIAVFIGFWEKFSDIIINSNVDNIILVAGNPAAPAFVEQLNSIINKFDTSKKLFDYNTFLEKAPERIAPYYESGHIAAIIGTSGTTGTPKGVCLTDKNLNAAAIGQKISGHYREEDKTLDVLLQSISYGFTIAHAFGVIGCHTVLIPEMCADKTPEFISKIKPDAFPAVSLHYMSIINSKEYAENKMPYIRTPFIGGSALDINLEKTLNNSDTGYEEKTGDKINVRNGYGSTECCGCVTANTYGTYKFRSIGIPLANINVSVFEPGTDKELHYGEIGEICVCGDTVMKGYLNNPDETANVLKRHSDGQLWLHQADLGWCDEDGHFFITDRIKVIFMRMGGFNVHPSKIEEYIKNYEGVIDCAVIGVPDPEEQTVPVAFLVTNEGANKQELIQKLRNNSKNDLSEMEIPVDWIFVDSLPRNAGGKVDKKALENIKNEARHSF